MHHRSAGVFRWRGTNAQRGKTALPDWEQIALNGRDVVLAFDSDAMTKASVRAALERAGRFLQQRGACVRYLLLPDVVPTGKTGIDKAFASGLALADIDRCVRSNLPPLQESSGDSIPLPPAPAFPIGIFPSDITVYLTAQARSIGVPVEMVAVPLVVFAGSTIGNAIELQLKRGWAVRSTWAGLFGGPGTKKTPALKAAQWPLNKLQAKLHDAYRKAMADHLNDLDAWEAKPKGERGEKPTPPKLDHLYSTDITLEALATYLEFCPGQTIIRDELSGFIGAMDKYRGKGDDRQQYLSLWAGTPIKTDRKGGGTVFAPIRWAASTVASSRTMPETCTPAQPRNCALSRAACRVRWSRSGRLGADRAASA